ITPVPIVTRSVAGVNPFLRAVPLPHARGPHLWSLSGTGRMGAYGLLHPCIRAGSHRCIRSAVLRQSADAVARRAPAESPLVNDLDQARPLQALESAEHGTTVAPGPAGDVGNAAPRRAVPGVSVEHQPNGDVRPAQPHKSEVNEGVQQLEALPGNAF